MKKIIQFSLLLIAFCCFSQQADYVDFEKVEVDIGFDVSQNKIYGKYNCVFEILNNVDSIYLDAVDMRFRRVKMHPKNKKSDLIFRGEVDNYYDNSKLWLKHNFKKGQKYILNFFFFKNDPKKALYFIDWENNGNNKQIWTQGQGKYTSNWLPSIDDMNEKIEFDLTISFKNDYEVIANGKLINKDVGEKLTKWHYDMQKPMSSYLVALAIGKYNKKVEYSKSGIPLEMYYYPEDSLKFESTYRYTKQMFDFLEEEIGVPYPWQNYKMVPVKDFLYAGMENTSLNIYSDAFVVDSIAFVDKNFVNINAHELAHQWFGDLVTETSGTHHWLQEGFATYYALLTEREVFGDDYYYWKLYEYAQELLEQDKTGQSTSLLDPKSSSTTFYKKGAWVLHMLRERVGNKAFKKGIKNYLKKHQFKNVETDDFIGEVEKASGDDLGDFVEIWLESKELPYDEMEGFFFLTSIDYKDFLQLDCEASKASCVEYLKISNNNYLKSEIIKKLKLTKYLKTLFNSKDLKVRQAIAQSFSKIPIELKEDYETLLDDKSYTTIEVALFNLWNNFPEEQSKYLNKTKGVVGFNDKNIRILWLTLAILTDGFEPKNKEVYFNELTSYTSSKYDFSIRQNAFQYLIWISSCADDCKENLKQATKHHNWRFRKLANSLLKKE